MAVEFGEPVADLSQGDLFEGVPSIYVEDAANMMVQVGQAERDALDECFAASSNAWGLTISPMGFIVPSHG